MGDFYSLTFDSNCRGWNADPDDRLCYLRRRELYFNDLLMRRGYVYLAEIMSDLGYSILNVPRCVGWSYRRNQSGEVYIDFGIIENVGNTTQLNFNVESDICNRRTVDILQGP